MPAGCKRIPEFLSDNVFGICDHNGIMIRESKNADVERILKYYGDCPCYNLVTHYKTFGKLAIPVIIVHIHFSDIVESFIQEKKDQRRLKHENRKSR